MSDVKFNKYNGCMSLKVLYKYYFIPLEKRPLPESVVLFSKHTVLNALAFQLAIWGAFHYTTISLTFSCHSFFIW